MTETAAKWARRVSEWELSGQTSVAYCVGKAFSAGGLRHWAHRLRRGDKPAASARPLAVRVARVVRPPAAPAVPAQSSAAPRVIGTTATAGEDLVVEVGAARVTVRAGFDRATLAAVVVALTDAARSAR